jgi:hypothetical protein
MLPRKMAAAGRIGARSAAKQLGEEKPTTVSSGIVEPSIDASGALYTTDVQVEHLNILARCQ